MEKPTEYTLTWEVTDEMTAKRIGSAGSKIRPFIQSHQV